MSPALPTRSTPDRPVAAFPVVRIVVVAGDSAESFLDCLLALESAQEYNSTPFDVAVVDNAAAASTREVIDGLDGDVTRVRLRNRVQLALARDLGVQRSTAAHLLFLEPGIRVQGPWLDLLVAALEADPRVAAVQPEVQDEQGHVLSAGGRVLPDGHLEVIGAEERVVLGQLAAPDFLTTGCVLVRRTAYGDGFDPCWSSDGYREADFAFQRVHSGGGLVCERRATVVSATADGVRLCGEDGSSADRQRFRRLWMPHSARRHQPSSEHPGSNGSTENVGTHSRPVPEASTATPLRRA